MVPALPPDQDLLVGLRAGDEQTFDAVVRAWSPAMLRLARYHVGSVAVAEEVVQEAWIAVVKQIAGFEQRSAMHTWVMRICANIARRHGARESRVRPIGLPSDGPTVDPDRFRSAGEQWAGYWTPSGTPAEWGPEDGVVSADTRRVLTEALRVLPERQAHVVALRDIHGLAAGEVAELLGLSTGNVRVILHRARATLRERLADHYSKEADRAS